MAPGLTAEDRKRIDLFAKVPRHQRRPQLLIPESVPEESDSKQSEGEEDTER